LPAKATTDGVLGDPSALGTMTGLPSSTAQIIDFDDPKSMPTSLAIRRSPFIEAKRKHPKPE
jgi:hypothetical protein